MWAPSTPLPKRTKHTSPKNGNYTQETHGAYPDAALGEMLRKLVLTRVERMRGEWLERQR